MLRAMHEGSTDQEQHAAAGEALVVRFLREHRLACPSCGYDLFNAAAARCPECGFEILLRLNTPDS